MQLWRHRSQEPHDLRARKGCDVVRKDISFVEFVLLATALMSLVGLATDMMLPALEELAYFFDLEAENDRQWIITALLIGIGVGQTFFGPLSDRFGRKPPIIVGLILFALGSALCAIASSFETLLVGRVIQGIGVAGPRIVSVAIVRDQFQGAKMAQVMSLIMGAFIMMPVLAPTAGQVLLWAVPWQALFVILLVVAVFLLLWFHMRMGETLVVPKSTDLNEIKQSFRAFFASPVSVGYTMASALNYGAVLGYINTSQQIMQHHFLVLDSYAFWFGLCALFISGAIFWNAFLVTRIRPKTICQSALVAQCLGATAFVGWYFVAQSVSFSAWISFCCVSLFLSGLTFGNFSAIALEPMGKGAGLAVTITATMNTLFGITVAVIIGLSYAGTVLPIILGFAVTSFLAILCIRWADLAHKKSSSVTVP